MIEITKMLLDDFTYEEFIHAGFKTEYASKSMIILKSEQAPVKDCKEGFTKKNVKTIFISDDAISLNKKVIYENDYQNNHTEKLNSIFTGNKDFQLESYVEQNYQGICSEKYESISTSVDEIRYESKITRKDPRDYTKDVNEEMKSKNNIHLIILNKIMNIVIMHVRKNADE